MELLSKINEWESAWESYVEALDRYDHAEEWAGEDWVLSVSRLSRNLEEAKRNLRIIDRDFCYKLGI